jgi:hypothetical protein
MASGYIFGLQSSRIGILWFVLRADTDEKDPAVRAGMVGELGQDVLSGRGEATSRALLERPARNRFAQFVRDLASTPIHPSSMFRTRWDLMILALMVYVCITAPVIVCFDATIVPGSELWWFETIVNAIFVLDIFLNLDTSYYGESFSTVLFAPSASPRLSTLLPLGAAVLGVSWKVECVDWGFYSPFSSRLVNATFPRQ